MSDFDMLESASNMNLSILTGSSLPMPAFAAERVDPNYRSCTRLACPWCMSKLVHFEYHYLKRWYQAFLDEMDEDRSKVDRTFEHQYANSLVIACLRDLLNRKIKFDPFKLREPVGGVPLLPDTAGLVWWGDSQTILSGGAAPASSSAQIVHVAAPVGAAATATDSDTEPPNGRRPCKKSDEELYGHLRDMSEEDWLALLNEKKLTRPNPAQFAWKVKFWAGRKTGWQEIGGDNRQNLLRIFFDTNRRSTAVSMTDGGGVQRTYQVFFFEQFDGVQLNIVSQQWRALKVCPQPAA